PRHAPSGARDGSPVRVVATTVIAALALAPPPTASADPRAETVVAWQRYVAQTEARLRPAYRWIPASGGGAGVVVDGVRVGIEAGTISDWRGSVLIRGVTLDRF